MLELTTIQQITIWILPVLFAVTFHEAAHAWVAYRLGDNTAKLLGRVSFNPINHVDLIGTIIMPIAVLVLSDFHFVFGWAKPVPIVASNFKKPRRDIALATAAGPLSNVIMALIWTAILKIVILINPTASSAALFIVLAAKAGVLINLLLAIFNLLPIPPLDGSKIVASMLPFRQAIQYEKIEPYGFFILLALMFSGALSWLLSAPINWSMSALSALFNL